MINNHEAEGENTGDSYTGQPSLFFKISFNQMFSVEFIFLFESMAKLKN